MKRFFSILALMLTIAFTSCNSNDEVISNIEATTEFEYTELQSRSSAKVIEAPNGGYEFKYNTVSSDSKLKIKGQMNVVSDKSDQMRVGFSGNATDRRLVIKNKTNVNVVLVFTSNDIVLNTNENVYDYTVYKAVNIPVNGTAKIIRSKKNPNKYRVRVNVKSTSLRALYKDYVSGANKLTEPTSSYQSREGTEVSTICSATVGDGVVVTVTHTPDRGIIATFTDTDGVMVPRQYNVDTFGEAYAYCEEIENIKEENVELEIVDKELEDNGNLGNIPLP